MVEPAKMSSAQGADFEVVACGRKTKKEYLGEHKRQEEMVGTYAMWRERLYISASCE
jgi:hypothetical protein